MIEDKLLLTIISELNEDYCEYLSTQGIDRRDESHLMARKYQRLMEIWDDVSNREARLEHEMKDKYLNEVLGLRNSVELLKLASCLHLGQEE